MTGRLRNLRRFPCLNPILLGTVVAIVGGVGKPRGYYHNARYAQIVHWHRL